MNPRKERRVLAAYKAAEKRTEIEERCAFEIPAELRPLWRRTRLSFQGTPEERVEQFMQYAHDHERESIAAVVEEAEDILARLIEKYQAA